MGAVAALLPAEGRILDAGCGPGRYLAKLAGRAVGSDLSLGMTREAARFAPVAVADLQHLPFQTASFAGALAAHVLYHVPDIGAAAAELARVCRPGGTVLVVTNGAAHLKELHDAMGIPSRGRFTLENGPDQLLPHLRVADLRRGSNRLLVPGAGPVVAYLESLRPFYEAAIPDPSVWAALRDRVRTRVEAEIAREGVWTATTDTGIMVCAPA